MLNMTQIHVVGLMGLVHEPTKPKPIKSDFINKRHRSKENSFKNQKTPTSRTLRVLLSQIKRSHSTKGESKDQILVIKPHHIKSTKIQHQHKFNSTN